MASFPIANPYVFCFFSLSYRTGYDFQQVRNDCSQSARARLVPGPGGRRRSLPSAQNAGRARRQLYLDAVCWVEDLLVRFSLAESLP